MHLYAKKSGAYCFVIHLTGPLNCLILYDTNLYILALYGALQFLEYYKEEGGFLNKVNKDGNSPLLVLLNEYSKQRDKSEKIETQTANIAAYFMKNTTTVILDKYGNTPLHVAAEYGFVKIMEALLKCGAMASRLNKKGRTALHVCLEKRKFFLKMLSPSSLSSERGHTNTRCPGCVLTSSQVTTFTHMLFARL